VIRITAVAPACDVPAPTRIATRAAPSGAVDLIVSVNATWSDPEAPEVRRAERHTCPPTEAGGVAQTLNVPESPGGVATTTSSATRRPRFAARGANGAIRIAGAGLTAGVAFVATRVVPPLLLTATVHPTWLPTAAAGSTKLPLGPVCKTTPPAVFTNEYVICTAPVHPPVEQVSVPPTTSGALHVSRDAFWDDGRGAVGGWSLPWRS